MLKILALLEKMNITLTFKPISMNGNIHIEVTASKYMYTSTIFSLYSTTDIEEVVVEKLIENLLAFDSDAYAYHRYPSNKCP